MQQIMPPATFSTKIDFDPTLFPKPRIIVSDIAYKKMYYYIDIASKEVGWLGTASEVGKFIYEIEDVWLLRQEVTGSETDIKEHNLTEFAEEIMKQPGGINTLNKMRFWGHSHVNMGVFASKTDDDTMQIFHGSGHEFFIRGIFNKNGEAKFSLYLYKVGLYFHETPWERMPQPIDPLRTIIEAEFKERVTERVMGFTQGGAYQQYHAATNIHQKQNVVGPNWKEKHDAARRDKHHKDTHHDKIVLPAHYQPVASYEERQKIRVWNNKTNQFDEFYDWEEEFNEEDTKLENEGGIIPELVQQKNEANKPIDEADKELADLMARFDEYYELGVID